MNVGKNATAGKGSDSGRLTRYPFIGPVRRYWRNSTVMKLNTRVERISLTDNRARRSAGTNAHRAPPAAPPRQASGRTTYAERCVRLRLTSAATKPPAAICPGAPMLKRPIRNEGVRPSATIARGAKRMSVSPNPAQVPNAPLNMTLSARIGSAWPSRKSAPVAKKTIIRAQ